MLVFFHDEKGKLLGTYLSTPSSIFFLLLYSTYFQHHVYVTKAKDPNLSPKIVRVRHIDLYYSLA